MLFRSLGTRDEPRPTPGAPFQWCGALGPEAGKAFQLESIEDVVLLQKTKIGIAAAMRLIVQPGGSCFLGTNAEQKGCVRGQDVLPVERASVDLQVWHGLHQIVDGFDLREKWFQLIKR